MSQEFEVGHSAVPNAATTTVEKPIASPTTTTIQPPWTKRHLNLILIGDVNSGKTAFLDLLANVCAGVPLEDFKPVHKAANERDSSQPGSNTNVPEFYTISCANGTEVNILDTPGLGDPRGIEIDFQNRNAIVKAIQRHFETVNAIIILANGSLYHTMGVEFVIKTISHIFPHSIANNIAFVLTMVDDPTMIVFDRSYLPDELKDAKVWGINNPFSLWMKYQKKIAENPRTLPEDFLEEMNDSIHRDYPKTLTTLSEVFQFLDKCEVQPMESAYSLKERPDIEAPVPNVIAGMN
ncbi:hypothetical protein F5878DRAFT_621643 [Lentinula raphanica]|uniref:G domain-containing protein n=1 Tax=Lentinula raphanica TaxID=153919 RepID=A0AA38UDP4_9AGAR|nr:hypothetical protein F5880DRAFT_643346 [Lentinula raphanica]KAJ3837691.1 hypothetical protein F5878DRAFT_621643 [Lentinula raphanica]